MVSAAQNLFAQHLKSSTEALGIAGLDPNIVVATGATGIGKLVPPNQMQDLEGLQRRYSKGLSVGTGCELHHVHWGTGDEMDVCQAPASHEEYRFGDA